MFKRLIAGLCALSCLAWPATAQDQCDMAKLTSAIDRYASDPFGPLNWRVLKGLGDPMVDAASRGGDFWSAQEEWKKIAASISPEGKYLKDFGYDCRIGYPLQVLKQRVSALDKDDAYVKQWLRVQDTVLGACTEQGAGEIKLPDPIEIKPELAKMQQQDRAYQEATIAFYRDKARAVELFRTIGTSDSPHKASARYNVANLLANGKRLAEARAEARAILADSGLASVHTITKELLGYIANLEDTASGWTELITDTAAIIEQPASAIAASEESRNEYAYALNDISFAGVDAKKDDWWLDGKLPEDATLSKALVDTAAAHPMVLWMMTGRSADQYGDYAPWSLMGEKWRARLSEMTMKALAKPSASELPRGARDMLLAMTTNPNDATRPALWEKARTAMAEAEKSCGTAPETASAAFLLQQAVRVSAEAGDFDGIYAELARVKTKDSGAYVDGIVRKLGEFLMATGNLKEARRFRDTLLTPDLLLGLSRDSKNYLLDGFVSQMIWMAENEENWNAALALHGRKTSHQLLNFLPAKTLRRLSEDVIFKPEQRALLARAAWTRDYVLGRQIADDTTRKMLTLNPELEELAAKAKTDYPKIGPERARLLTILRSPRYGILVTSPDLYDGIEMQRDNFNEVDSWDVNDKNWWCPWEPDRQLAGLRSEYDFVAGTGYLLDTGDDWARRRLAPILDEALLVRLAEARDVAMKNHPMVKAAGWKELAALAKAPSGPKKLTEAAVRWGKTSKGDDGAPEALALAVRTTRYGCRWHGRHGAYSKAAQQMLQTKFKGTEWAKSTPYWFDCMYQVWDAEYNKVAECKPKTWVKQAPLN